MNKSYVYGVMALGLLFTGCQSDKLSEPEQINTDVDRTLYVNLNIRGDIMSGTRATDGNPTDGSDFNKGTGESEVKEAYFVFYDNNGTLVGEIVKVNLPTNTPLDENIGYEDATGIGVDKYYQSIVPVSVYKGENDPTQVVCYINPITPQSLQNPLSVIQTNTRDLLYSLNTNTSTKYFAMSNSVYYPVSESDPQSTALPQIAVPIEADQLFKTKDAAKDALKEGNVVDIYVERYAAKLNFKQIEASPYVTATSLINNPAEVPVQLDFVANRWALNATCEESYIVKSFLEEGNGDKPLPNDYTYGKLNGFINANSYTSSTEDGVITVTPGPLSDTEWQWNKSNFHRSYWAMSPAYFTSVYPEVSSDVTDLKAGLNQKYYSYNELTVGENPEGFAFDDTNDHYFHETTVGARALKSKNPAAAVASVILVGDYTVTIGGTKQADGTVTGGTELAKGTTFYTYLTGSNGNPLVYFNPKDGDNPLGLSSVENGESMLRRFIEQTSILFKKVGNDYVQYDFTNNADMTELVSILTVAAPSIEVKGDMKVAERYRTLQFKKDANTNNVYVATTDGYQAITTDFTLDDANKALMQNVGFCVKYETGSAYFNIPVKHYGWYRKANTQINATSIDWNIVRVGDFGVVRNHSYSIEVDAITGLATGIGGHDSPIVPPADTKDYFVAYRVNILKWAVVPTQHVNL